MYYMLEIGTNVIHVENIPEYYDKILSYVRGSGDTVTARDHQTIEVTNLTVISADPTTNRIWDKDDSRRSALESEIRTVKQGVQPEFIANQKLDEKLDLDDGVFYEDIIRKRISEDWHEWKRLLDDDTHTRKAVSLFGSNPDSPCTSRVQWMIRDGELHCFTYNRSQDMEFAFPMDVGLFEEYQCQLADELDVPVGRHEHVMTSAHIYL